MEFKVLSGRPPDFHVPGVKAVHAQCDTFRAWKVLVPVGDRWYIIDEKKKGIGRHSTPRLRAACGVRKLGTHPENRGFAGRTRIMAPNRSS